MATYKEINKFVRKKGNESKRILSTNLKKLGKVSSGQTLNSLEVRFFTTASNFGFRLLASPVIDFIDQGRKPGGKMPPPGSMIEWIKRKGLTGINAKGIIWRPFSKKILSQIFKTTLKKYNSGASIYKYRKPTGRPNCIFVLLRRLLTSCH